MSDTTLPVDEAMRRLAVIPDYDAGNGPAPCVHTFMQSSMGLLGAHWYLPSVRAAMERWGVEEAGPEACAMRHGLVVIEEGRRPVFFETLAEAPEEAA